MSIIIPANNVKYFAKAVHCLCRLGNEIYLQCEENELHVQTLNASRSTFATFSFEKSFFDGFVPLAVGNEEKEFLTGKVSVRTFLQVFRSLNFIERSVEKCEIQLSDNQDLLVFTLFCKHAVVKTFQVNYEECDALKAIYAKDLSPNKLTSSSKLLLEVITNFLTSLDEITLSVSPCKVSLSSYTDEEEVGKVMSTEMNLDPKEFSYFQVGIDSCVSFSLKDLRSVLNFAESCGSECRMSFEYGGKPFVVEMTQDGVFTANFVLATIAGDTQTQQTGISIMKEDSTARSRLNSMSKSKREKTDQRRNGTSLKTRTNNNNPSDTTHFDEIHDELNTSSNYARISTVLFTDMQLSQRADKEILAPDSDVEP